MLPPSWLPYRIRSAWNGYRVWQAIRSLDSTRSIEASTDAEVELQMLVCRRDVRLCVLAIKSLFRFLKSPIRVTITSDGSLSDADKQWINEHIRHVRWLGRLDCLGLPGFSVKYPLLSALYQTDYHPLCKLLHPFLLGEVDKQIILDADTAFFRSPRRLLQWCEDANAVPLFLHDHRDEDKDVPQETRDAFDELKSVVTASCGHWNMPYFFFNSGFLAYERSHIDLAIGEAFLCWRSSAPPRYLRGTAKIWFGDWTPEQTCYQLIFSAMNPAAEPLDESYRIGPAADAGFNHFLREPLVLPQSLNRLRRLVSELPSAQAGSTQKR